MIKIFLCLTALVSVQQDVWGQPMTQPSALIVSSIASPDTSLEDSCEYLDNGCPADFDIHLLLPHETSCRKFYFCVRGERVLRSCASGLVFNPDIENCDHAGSIDRTCEEEDSSSEEDSISEEYVEPEEIELLPNGCPVNYTISMYLPHEYYCNVYYQCVFGQKVNQRCPDGTHYNQEVKNCDHIATANCQLPGGNFIETTTTTAAPTTPSFVLQPNGCPVDQSIHWLVAHEDCTKFYFCVWGGLVESNCPDGLYFNPVAQYCDNPALAGCANDPCKKKPCSNTNSSTESTTISTTEFTTPQETDGSTSFTTSPTEFTSPTTIINTSDPTTETPIETTSSSSTIDISNPTTNITTEYTVTEAISSSSTVFITDPTTEIPTEATVSSTIIGSSTTDIIIEPTTSPTTIEISAPTTNNTTEATSSSSTIGITDPTTEIPTEATVSSTIMDSSTTDITTDATSSSSTLYITDPTMEIPTEATMPTTISDTSNSTTEIPSVSTTTIDPGSPDTTTSSSSTEFTTITIPTISKSTAVPSTTTEASTSSTSLTTEDSCEYLDNGCPVDFDMHLLLPHETSCKKFYFCVRGEKVLRKCASGLVFNPDIGNCVHAGNIDRTCEEEVSSEEDNISEEYIEPEEIELLPNGCPVNYTISMYLPHEYYCNIYYQCIYGQKMERYCPSNTHFNPTSQTCDHIFNANCSLPGGDYVTSTTTQAPTEATTKPIDLLPNGCPRNGSINWMVAHEECTKYYVCVWGSYVEMGCPDGTHFNAVEQFCDNPATAGCKICTKPCCSGNDGNNNCDGNGNTDNENDEEISNEDDYTTEDNNDENINNSYESAETDCNGAENENECIEEKRCKEDCNTLPKAHQDCDKYWICYRKKAVLVTCSEGLHFNPSTSTCDYPCYAGCVRENVQATSSNDGLKLFLPWDEIDEEIRSILKRKGYFH